MRKRKLGGSGLTVSVVALGGNVFGWTADEAASFRVLDAYTEAGGNLIDTADIYSTWVPGNRGGESETIIGKWMQARRNRDQIVLATKVGKEMGPNRKGLSGSYILRAAEDSLRRLRTDRIDLYQAHEDDPATPLEEAMEAFARLARQGKVRAVGASNYGAERLAEALRISAQLGVPGYQSLQPCYNLYDRSDYEASLEPLCRAKGLGVIGYYSLASGFLTGKYRSDGDLSRGARGATVTRYLDERGFRILTALDEVSRRLGSNPARVALAWLIARPGVTAPIASATSPEQVNDLVEATKLELDGPAVERLDAASAW
jgi:aryl-alcohol dehydrogenase-like predicted oxidoreductase